MNKTMTMTAKLRGHLVLAMAALFVAASASAQPASTNVAGGPQGARGGGFRRMAEDSTNIAKLATLRAQDVCILPDPVSKTYYMIAAGVRAWTSKDLVNWQGPKTIFRTPSDIWGDIRTAGIWAPEMHYYKGKYYLFLCRVTFKRGLLCATKRGRWFRRPGSAAGRWVWPLDLGRGGGSKCLHRGGGSG
jgi:Glycosyl hydrolases family 43